MLLAFPYTEMVLYYNCKFNLINLKQGAHIHQPIARPVPHACTEPYQPGSAVAAIQIHAPATITD